MKNKTFQTSNLLNQLYYIIQNFPIDHQLGIVDVADFKIIGGARHLGMASHQQNTDFRESPHLLIK